MIIWALYKGTDRYDFPGIENYILQGEVMAVNDDFKFEWEQEKGQRYWRRKFSGKLIFKDDALLNSYTTLKAIYDSSERCDNWVIAYIKEGCESVPDYNIYYKGFLNYINWEIDEDKRVIIIKEIDPFDKYSVITENLKVEHNILFAGERVETWAAIDTHASEMVEFKADNIEWVISFESGDPSTWFYIKNHVTYEGAFNPIETWGGVNMLCWAYKDGFGNVGSLYVRDVRYIERAPGYCSQDTDEMEEQGYKYITSEIVNNKAYCKWIRCEESETGDWVTNYSVISVVTTLSSANGYPDKPDSGYYYLIYDGTDDDYNGYYPVNIWVNFPSDPASIQKYSENRFVKDVMEYMLAEIGFTGSYRSDFFDLSSDVMYWDQNLWLILNRRQYLLISQKSDVRLDSIYISYDKEGYPDIDAATKATLTLDDFLTMLGIFNIHWYIDDDGDFRIEHEKYFHNGLRYTNIILDINDDLTSNPRAIYKKKYSFDNSELPKHELFKMMESYNLDFTGESIGYDNRCLNQEKNESKEWTFDNVTTDLQYIYKDVEAISKDGFCLFASLIMVQSGVPRITIPCETGRISGKVIINGHLSWANLHHYYWKHDRSSQYGWMNFQETTFLSWKMTKIQTEITIMECCTWDFNPYNWYVTELGYGKVEKAVEDNKTGTLKLTLKYYA